MTIFERTVFQEAIEKYGEKSQITMVFEEMSELQKELCKALRGTPNIDHIAEEMADVEIMLEQMKILFDCENAVKAWHEAKTVRLEERVGG